MYNLTFRFRSERSWRTTTCASRLDTGLAIRDAVWQAARLVGVNDDIELYAAAPDGRHLCIVEDDEIVPTSTRFVVVRLPKHSYLRRQMDRRRGAASGFRD